MARRSETSSSDVLTVLGLLVDEAPAARLESLLTEARRRPAPAADADVLEQAVRLALEVHGRRERRQQREAHLTALLDTARDLCVPHDLDAMLKVVTRRARLLLGTDMAYISFPDPDDGTSYIRASDGHVSTLNIGLQLPGDAGLGSSALTKLAPIWSSDYLADPHIQHSAAIDAVVRAEGLHAILAVPLSHGAAPFGALYVADRRVRHFTAEEIALFTSLGELAGPAIEQVRVLDEAQSSVRALERSGAQGAADLRDLRELGRVHRELIDQAVGGTGPQALALAASEHLAGGLRIYAANGTLLATAGNLAEAGTATGAETAPDTAAVAVMNANAADGPVEVDDGMWAVQMTAGRQNLGTLLVKPEQSVRQQGEQMLRLVAQAAAVQVLLDSSKTFLAQARAHEELLEDLLAVPQRPPHQLEERARRLGIDLRSPHVVVVVRPGDTSRGRLFTLASSYAHGRNGLKSTHLDSVVMLLPGTDAGAAARAACDKLTLMLGEPVTVSAAGPVSDAASIFHCYREAQRCLDAMTALGATGRSSSARELGFLGVLLADDVDVESFVGSVIGSVLRYDAQRGTELTQTLDAYFQTGSSPTRAAQRLHVHPNTVARRLERISELLGPDWQRPERALEVQLALKLFRVRRALVDRRSALAGPDTPERT